jgi:small-conductance mechanosensitive channel
LTRRGVAHEASVVLSLRAFAAVLSLLAVTSVATAQPAPRPARPAVARDAGPRDEAEAGAPARGADAAVPGGGAQAEIIAAAPVVVTADEPTDGGLATTPDASDLPPGVGGPDDQLDAGVMPPRDAGTASDAGDGGAAGGRDAPPDATVRLHRTAVFTVLVPRGALSAEQRANAATTALKRALEEGGTPEVRVDQQGEVAVVYVGPRPVIELGPDDAQAAGEVSVQVLAAKVAGQIGSAIRTEQSRSQTLMTILSLAFVIFSALIALFLIRKAGELVDRGRAWIAKNPDRLPAMRVRSIEVVRPASFRAGLSIGLSAAKALLQLGLAYGWLLFALSLFESTRGYAERLTGFVFGPLYALLGRIAGSLPLLVVGAIAAIALIVLVRFVGLFFDSVQRGEAKLEWIPPDLAAPTSLLVRAAVILVFFVIAAPLVTGDDDGALTRVGTIALVALGLASTPLLSSMAVGAVVVYGRRLKVGDFADVGGRSGRVQAITLFEVLLLDEHGKELRVPHLLGLVHPTRVLGPLPLVTVDITLSPQTAGQREVRAILLAAASSVGSDPRVDLLTFDVDGATYRVGTHADASDAKSQLCGALAAAIAAASIPLGRPASK